MLAVLLGLLGMVLRLRVGLELPLDHDEPVYAKAALTWGECLRDGEFWAIPASLHNAEHPALVKLCMALPVPFLGERAWWLHTLMAGRALSVLAGGVQVGLLAWCSPVAGLFLALHSLHAKYTAEAGLEALPGLLALGAVLAGARSRGGDRWAWTSWILLGATIAGKYAWGIVGGVVVTLALTRPRRWAVPVGGGVAILAFLLLDPAIWESPLRRLAASLLFHGGYADAWPLAGGPASFLGVLATAPAKTWHPGLFPWADDPFVLFLGVPGLLLGAVRGGRFGRAMAGWFLLGVAFLAFWPVRWPHYALLVVVPLCAGAGTLVEAGLARCFRDPDRRSGASSASPDGSVIT